MYLTMSELGILIAVLDNLGPKADSEERVLLDRARSTYETMSDEYKMAVAE